MLVNERDEGRWSREVVEVRAVVDVYLLPQVILVQSGDGSVVEQHLEPFLAVVVAQVLETGAVSHPLAVDVAHAGAATKIEKIRSGFDRTSLASTTAPRGSRCYSMT